MIYSLITMSEALPTTNCFPKLTGMIPERWKVKNLVVRPREVEDPASVQMTIPCMCQPTEPRQAASTGTYIDTRSCLLDCYLSGSAQKAAN